MPTLSCFGEMPALPLRVFLASPGDVTDERALAIRVLEQLQYEPFLKGKISVETVAWDKQGADTPLLASMTPQEAISLQRPKPSACDVVVVIFWSRMGTPLPANTVARRCWSTAARRCRVCRWTWTTRSERRSCGSGGW